MTLLPAYFFFPIHDVQERLSRHLVSHKNQIKKEAVL